MCLYYLANLLNPTPLNHTSRIIDVKNLPVDTITEKLSIPGDQKTEEIVFRFFPKYAKFLRENHLVEYVKDLLQLSWELELPLMKRLAHIPEDQLLELSIQGHKDHLITVEENRLRERLDNSLKSWEDDDMKIISQDDIALEDIAIGSYIRKEVLLKYLPLYTADVVEMLAVIKEIDFYEKESNLAASKTYIKILKKKINEHALFIEAITNTTPGGIYVYDLAEKKEVYNNGKLYSLLGYDERDMEMLGENLLEHIIHPDDLQLVTVENKNLDTIREGEIRSMDCRIRCKNGAYLWLRNVRSMFRKDIEGNALQIIGITTDITEEKRNEERIKHNEEQLLEAQEMAKMGSYVLDLNTYILTVTPQFLSIYETDNWHLIVERIHPADRPKIEAARNKAIEENGTYDLEYRYSANNREKIIWAKGAVVYLNGTPMIKGTVMDVTERKHMIQRLKRSEDLYKQAETMSHIGNWVWDLVNNRLEWSDELYRIYELEPGSGISYDMIFSFNHPDDAANVSNSMKLALETKEAYDFNFRIVTKSGKTKILNAKGEVMVDKGTAYKMFGTVQDITEKQSLIEQLQKSDTLYKQAQAMSHIGNWEWTPGDNRLVWSDEVYEIFGLDRNEELFQSKIITYRHPDDAAITESAIAAVGKLEGYDITYRIIRKDGTIRYVNSIARVIESKEGKPVKVVGTTQDVTEKQALIEQLKKSEILYKQAQAMTHMGNWEWSVSDNTITWSDELYKIFGFPAGEEHITPEKYWNHIYPDDREALSLAVQNCLTNLQPYDIYHRILCANNEVRNVHCKGSVIFDIHRKPYKIFGTIQDVTEHQRMIDRIQESEAFIQKIANTTPSLIASYNVNTGKYSYFNQAFEKILGYDQQVIFEKGVQFFVDIVHPDDLPSLMEKNAAVLEEANNNPPADGAEMIAEFKYRMKNAKGKYRWFHTYGTIFDRNKEGKVENVLNVSVDITDQEEAEQALYKNNLLLKQSNASLEEYAYVASHDLKEPLRKISTFGDRLMTSQYEALNEDGRTYLEKIIHSARRMQKMVNDLLSISVITTEQSFEPYSLQKIYEECLQTLEYKIEEKNAAINAGTLPEAYIVPSQFRQLFQNLVSNSLKFVRENVTPEINITCEYLTPAQVAGHKVVKAKNYLKIDFADNGIGLDNIYATKIFTIFQRLHGRTEYEGTGIGLAICKKIVENHGGVIFAEGVPGNGAVFTVIIPA